MPVTNTNPGLSRGVRALFPTQGRGHPCARIPDLLLRPGLKTRHPNPRHLFSLKSYFHLGKQSACTRLVFLLSRVASFTAAHSLLKGSFLAPPSSDRQLAAFAIDRRKTQQSREDTRATSSTLSARCTPHGSASVHNDGRGREPPWGQTASLREVIRVLPRHQLSACRGGTLR